MSSKFEGFRPDEIGTCGQCGRQCETGFIDDDGYCDECVPWEDEHLNEPMYDCHQCHMPRYAENLNDDQVCTTCQRKNENTKP